jgi:hypothetical protein
MNKFKEWCKTTTGTTVLILVIWWGALPFLLTIGWAIDRIFFPGIGVMHQSWSLALNNWIWNNSAIFWLWLTIGGIGSLIIIYGIHANARRNAVNGYRRDTYRYDRTEEGHQAAKDSVKRHHGFTYVVVAVAILTVFSFTQVVAKSWNADKNVGRYYSSATVFYTPSASNVPQSLHYLVAGAKRNANGCAFVGNADVASCVQVGSLPTQGFAPRVSSATGATIVMQRTSGGSQNVELLTDTMTYLNGNGKDGVWSAIRDGSGNITPMEGVVEWKGSGLPTECTFSGNDELNRALNGAKTNSLSNYIAEKYPTLIYSESDVWGYCKGSQPVVVFPVSRQLHYRTQTVNTPAGVIIMTGSRSGTPNLSYHENAQNLPGPVYSTSIADSQLDQSSWAVGRMLRTRAQFGYEPTTSGAQAGNVQDYLLRSNKDGHVYWVTPLTLRGSSSQLFVAYSMVRADTVRAGHLNPYHIYVLSANDIRRVNIDSLEASARDYLSQLNPGFFSSGGSLIEFTPTVGDVWRAFGEINGRVVYRLDISASDQVAPTLVSLENFSGQGSGTSTGGSTSTGSGTTPASNASCGQPLASLTQAQIVQCLKFFATQVASPTNP